MQIDMDDNLTVTTVQKDCDMMMTDDIILIKSINLGSQQNQEDPCFNPRPQLVEEYIPEIFEHLKEIEFDHLPSAGYMKSQTDINEKMRGILIDWLVEVHLKFKLLPETLFLTVNLIDRYLEAKHIMRNKLQLVGVTSMLIACKYEEIYAPEIRDFVYITDKAYTKEEILAMENDILAVLQYNVTVPSGFRYLEIYNYFLKIDETSFMFCRYLLELFLVDYKMLKYNPSLLASSTLYITVKITKKGDIEKVCELTGYTEEKLRECAKDICVIMDGVEKSSLQAVKKKFSLSKFLEVAKIKFN
jgi:cyclin B